MSCLRLVSVAVLTACGLSLTFADKKPLDPSVYDGWKAIRGTTLSRDGHWLVYLLTPQEGDSSAVLRNLDDGHTVTIPRGANFRFSADSKYAVGMVAPAYADVKAARRKKAKPEDMPKSSLVVVDLSSGNKTQIDKVASYTMAEDDAGWMAYKLEPEVAPAKAPEPKAPEPKAPDAKAPPAAPAKKPGERLVIRNLGTGKEETIPFVAQMAVAKHGSTLIYATATKDGKGDGATLLTLATDKKISLSSAAGEYPQLAVSADGENAAFQFRPDKKPDPAADKTKVADKAPEPPIPAQLFVYKSKTGKTERVGLDSMPTNWAVNDKSGVSFSEKGTRVLYSTYPAPPAPLKEVPDDEKVSVDVWTWKDTTLMPAQLLEAEAERNRGYLAIYDVARGKSMQIANREMRSVSISDKGDGRFAIGRSEEPYQLEGSWNPGYEDVMLVDLKSNTHSVLFKKFNGQVDLSPKGESVAVYDGGSKSWSAIDTATGRRSDLSSQIPNPVYLETIDTPETPPPYGLEGWLSETQPLIADRFDLWVCDVNGKKKPEQITHGRTAGVRYLPLRLDPEVTYLSQNDMVLSAFNDDTKQSGFYTLHDGVTKQLVMGDKAYGGLVKAKNADRVVFTRQDFVEYPDLWVSNLALDTPTKVSDANPQQKDYNWGKAELVHWTSLDGTPLSGILIKPENFDYSKKYPLITYFYERLSDELNVYHTPAPSASTINLTYFASNGYCVFVPDIPYRVGYPGYSALSAIVPGVQSIVNRGYIDPKRLGIQGQSWGGYQVGYLVTQTNMFAAAEAGAPVGDMFSAYGGIRYGSGVVREMQYEHGQSRIGGTPWDSTLRYIENSPVFFADKVETPLMIMSNDQDGAVPHTQGIEYFTALRRLGKPCWMVVYNGEDHNIMVRKNRKDFGIRLSQFFDYYLKGAPMPEWMAKGIPAVDKGRTMGLEPAPNP